MERKPELIKRLIAKWADRDNRWLSVPCTLAALFVLLVMVKSCQGIAYNFTNECKIYKLGYTIDEAKTLVATLSEAQEDTLIAHQEHDTIAIPVLGMRYFIDDNFSRYLAFHKKDSTSAPLDVIVALVNVGYDRDRESSAVPCDTSKGQLMLVNGRHYLDENYKPENLATFSMDYCYENQRAQSVVVDAFMVMQQACKEQTDFDTSVEGVWMREHCHDYGFILRYPKKQSQIFGFAYEPWHLRYVGKDVAKRIHDEDITFDEYYAYYIEGPHAKAQSR